MVVYLRIDQCSARAHANMHRGHLSSGVLALSPVSLSLVVPVCRSIPPQGESCNPGSAVQTLTLHDASQAVYSGAMAANDRVL